MSEQSKALSTGSHNYTKAGPPFQLGERQVRWATEIFNDPNSEQALTRKVLLDAETGKEINEIIDLGSHVIHSEADGPYTLYRVVDEQLRLPQYGANAIHEEQC
jgi:hypothetical protein